MKLTKVRTPPWSHQARAVEFLDRRGGRAILAMRMGTGKTKVVIDWAQNRDEVKKVLVVCPSRVIDVWGRELASHCVVPHHFLSLSAQAGTIPARAKALASFFAVESGYLRVAAVNYEVIWSPAIRSAAEAAGVDLLVVDESHRIKSPYGKAAKAVHAVSRTSKHAVCLTGTPAPHTPLDVWSQAYAANQRTKFGDSYVRFRNRFALMHRMFPSKLVRLLNVDEFKRIMAEESLYVGEEVLDLPPEVHQDIEFDVSPSAATMYTSLKEELIADVYDTEGNLRGSIQTPNVLAKLVRMQQIICGHSPVTGQNGSANGEFIPVDETREKVLESLISDEQDEKWVVFCRFRHDLRAVERVCRRLGLKYGEISGSSRTGIDSNARFNPSCDVVAAQYQSGGVGIDLTAARYGVFYSSTWSSGDAEQAAKRVHRPGQSRPVTYYHLLARIGKQREESLDHVVRRTLEGRQKTVLEILEELKHGKRTERSPASVC